jgi:hypothetical protein
MASMRKEAEETYGRKLDRMGLGISTASTGAKADGHVYPQDNGSQGNAQGGRAEGYGSEEENERTMEAKAPKKLRLDRQPFAHGGAVKQKKGATTVNVIIAPQGGGAGAAPPPPMPPGPPPAMMKPPGPMPAPGGGPEMPGAGAPPPMMRASGGVVPDVKRPDVVDDVKSGKIKFPVPDGRPGSVGRATGGRVPMDAGAGSGEGRLEKIAAYGKKARA